MRECLAMLERIRLTDERSSDSGDSWQQDLQEMKLAGSDSEVADAQERHFASAGSRSRNASAAAARGSSFGHTIRCSSGGWR